MFKEFDELSEVSNSSLNVRIDDVMKKSKTCSTGELTNGKVTMWLFGFDSGVHRRSFRFTNDTNIHWSCQTVKYNVHVKCLWVGDQLEILVSYAHTSGKVRQGV